MKLTTKGAVSNGIMTIIVTTLIAIMLFLVFFVGLKSKFAGLMP